jgi:hypothetical protein
VPALVLQADPDPAQQPMVRSLHDGDARLGSVYVTKWPIEDPSDIS